MKVEVTQADIDFIGDSGLNPIELAILRQYGKDCSVDKRFIIFDGNRFPFRLPLSAEVFIQSWYRGSKVEPFTFDVAG